MADLTKSKDAFASEMQTLASRALKLAQDMDEMNASYSVHGFASGGAHAFADADFTTENTHLTATVVSDAMFAIGTLANAASTGVRNSLRECLVGGLP